MAIETVVVKPCDLPVHCPTDDVKLWNEHPRVFIELTEKDSKNTCPYCGTVFQLVSDTTVNHATVDDNDNTNDKKENINDTAS